MFSFFKKKRQVEDEQNTVLFRGKLSFAATEAYKLLRANLMFAIPAEEGQGRAFCITSAIRGEGKSTTSVNLAYTLAETGKRVLLVDADLRLPTVAKKLEIRMAPGLSNVLAGIETVENALWHPEGKENLAVLTSGDIPPNPTELLGSARMAELLKTLREQFDFIVIDVPPVNIVSDALVVSGIVDGYVVVVKEGYSTRRELNACMRGLAIAESRVLGIVMTGAMDGSSGRYRYKKYKKYGKYGYRYGSKYGHRYAAYAESEEGEKSEEAEKTVEE